MKNWLKEILTNNQPLKRVGGLTFKTEKKMPTIKIKIIIRCENCGKELPAILRPGDLGEYIIDIDLENKKVKNHKCS